MLQVLPNYNTAPISTGDQSNPVILVIDGATGKEVVQGLFLHNNEAAKYYTNISMRAELIPQDWAIKLLAQKKRPTKADWAKVESGNIITFQNIGSPTAPDLDYHPFWILLEVPPGTTVQTVLSARLKAAYIELSR